VTTVVRSLLALVGPMVMASAMGAVSQQQLAAAASKVDKNVIAWRRDIHEHPELSNREFRTAALVAAHLKKLGLEPKTKVAHTGVTAVLRGGKPGPIIALRADMDALPVTEQADVPFKSKATAEYLGKSVGVMHACGHDAHTAILMGVAEALVAMRQDLPGTVMFIFQPAEEGAPEGEEGGARVMMKEGMFAELKPAAIFGLHVVSAIPSGVIGYRSGPFMAGSDIFRIDVKGRQAHGSRPWAGVDPIVAAAQIVLGLQTIVSRQIDITSLPAVVTVGKFDGGVRNNIIPDSVEMRGTIRTFNPTMRADIMERIEHTAEAIAASSGASATVSFSPNPNPVVHNEAQLTQRVLPSLRKVAGANRVQEIPLQTGAEDFAYFGQQAPSFFFFVGVTPDGPDVAKAATNHSPLFYIDEPAIAVATRALLTVAVDYLQGQ
jgi:amidohydrolase